MAPTSLSRGVLAALSAKEALVKTSAKVGAMTTLKLHLVEADERASAADLYGKILRVEESGAFVLRFTTMAPEIEALLTARRTAVAG
jgi:hypothetical protein